MAANLSVCENCGERTWRITVPGMALITSSLGDDALPRLLRALWIREWARFQCVNCGHSIEVEFFKEEFLTATRDYIRKIRIAGLDADAMVDEEVRDWARDNLTSQEHLAPFVSVVGRDI